MKQLIVDYIPFEITPQQINESMSTNDGKLIVKGVLQRAEAKNQNGRVYPKELLMREAKKYTENFIQQKRALGELDHPDSSVVNLQNASHNVMEMHFNGNDLVGTVRGLGSVENIGEGAQEVQPDFELIAFDFVSNPSTHGAFLSPMNESVDKTQQYEQRPDCGIWCRTEQLIHDIITEK
jgi:hypothetical protein